VRYIEPGEIDIPVRFGHHCHRRSHELRSLAWGNQGHEIVAIIAPDNLSPAARGQVAGMLAVASDTGSVEKAMAAASVRPDTEFREEDRATAP
jgi:hypothetical protein